LPLATGAEEALGVFACVVALLDAVVLVVVAGFAAGLVVLLEEADFNALGAAAAAAVARERRGLLFSSFPGTLRAVTAERGAPLVEAANVDLRSAGVDTGLGAFAVERRDAPAEEDVAVDMRFDKPFALVAAGTLFFSSPVSASDVTEVFDVPVRRRAAALAATAGVEDEDAEGRTGGLEMPLLDSLLEFEGEDLLVTAPNLLATEERRLLRLGAAALLKRPRLTGPAAVVFVAFGDADGVKALAFVSGGDDGSAATVSDV
jgi:hypothetical protein